MMQIETGMPIPKQDCRTIYPFLSLEVGQSFFVPDGNHKSIRAKGSALGKRHGLKFKTAKQPGGVRAWRVR